MFAGSFAAAGVAGLSQIPGARLVRAQSATYEVVSFGPITEGVRADGYFLPRYGVIQGMHGNGTAFGRIAASPEKFTPSLFNADGAVTKLKSGTYGARVAGLNSGGTAVGAAYDTIDGRGSGSVVQEQPVAWIDGEFVRLPVPDAESASADLVGSARSVSEDGVVFGSGNGHSLRWTNGEPEILPRQIGETLMSYYAILPDGALFAREHAISTQTYRLGVLRDDAFEPLDVSDTINLAGFIQVLGVNSAGATLIYDFTVESTSAMYVANVLMVGEETVVIDPRPDGIAFRASGFNAANQAVGIIQERRGADVVQAIWDAGEFTLFEDVLPADHGFHMITLAGISDDGVIAGSGFDEDGAFHPLLFVPA